MEPHTTPLNAWGTRLGPRGRVLIVCSMFWTLIAIGLAMGIDPIGEYVSWLIPRWVRVLGWAGTAAYALACAPRNPTRPPTTLAGRAIRYVTRDDRYAYGWLTLMPAVRAGSLLYAWVIDVIPGAPDGDDYGWYRSLFYVAMCVTVWFLAGRDVEPSERS